MHRILTSGRDVPDLAGYLRTGVIQRFVPKPAPREDLLAAVQSPDPG